MQLVAQLFAVRKYRLLAAFLAWATLSARAQEVKIILGPDEVGANQAWTITVTATNTPLRHAENFPEVPGFKKRGTSSQSQTSIINGQVTSSQSLVMTYVPSQQGTFTLLPFKMKINDELVSSPGKKITVGPPVQAAPDPFQSLFGRDPYEEFFGRSNPEFIDIKEDALLTLTTSKNEVYLGEGFTATLSFLVAENNRAPMQFYDLGRQLGEILKRLRPANCWEENFNIENIEGESIEINGKGYTQYKLYQGTFYPLTTQPIVFPSVGLDMIKYRVAKNPSYFGQNRQEDYKKFFSQPKTVKVKELPPHPLRNRVAVGTYRLSEKISTAESTTGASVGYDFTVTGEGNISGIEKPATGSNLRFDIYEPNIRQTISRTQGKVTGSKTFSYYLIPKEPGSYPMRELFQWIYFDPVRQRYDTLLPAVQIRVSGESQQNLAIESSAPGSFYDRLWAADYTPYRPGSTSWLRWLFYGVAGLLFLAAVTLMVRKPKG